MKPLNDEEVQALHGLLMYGEEFTSDDYYAVQSQFKGIRLYDKRAIKRARSGRLKITTEARKFLEQHNQEK
jgi:hypothetical protein